jgi:hypothetical protein
MKTKFSTILLLFMATTVGLSNDKYQEVMQKSILAVYQGKTPDELQPAINTLERVGGAEKTKWEPFYYAAFGYIMMATKEVDLAKKDRDLDLAMVDLDQAKLLVPKESEVVALEGFIHMIRLSVDPGTRGQQYSGLAMQAFAKAVALDPENPRALALMSQMQFGTAKFFNSSTDEACTTAQKAIEKFEVADQVNPLAPQWGKEMAMRLLEQCK